MGKGKLAPEQVEAIANFIKHGPMKGGKMHPGAWNLKPGGDEDGFKDAVKAAKDAGVHPKMVIKGQKKMEDLEKVLTPEQFKAITSNEKFITALHKATREHA